MKHVAAALICVAHATALNFECSETPLSVSYDIKYYSGEVNCGNLLLESDIGGTHAWIAPTVKFAAAQADKFYALAYIDPDVRRQRPAFCNEMSRAFHPNS